MVTNPVIVAVNAIIVVSILGIFMTSLHKKEPVKNQSTPSNRAGL